MNRTRPLVFAVFCLGLSAIGCSNSDPKAVVVNAQNEIEVDLSVVTTIGNHTYVPINLAGKPSEKIREILTALRVFEEDHPELEVLSFHMEKQQDAHGIAPEIFGIWITHRPVSSPGS